MTRCPNCARSDSRVLREQNRYIPQIGICLNCDYRDPERWNPQLMARAVIRRPTRRSESRILHD